MVVVVATGDVRRASTTAPGPRAGTSRGRHPEHAPGAERVTEGTGVHDPYAVLGLSRGASDAEVVARHRTLIVACHPDRFPQASAAERAGFEARAAAVNAAAQIILDPGARRQHERYLARLRPRMDAAHGGVPTDPQGPYPGRGRSSEVGFDYRDRAASEFDVSHEPHRDVRRSPRRRRRR